jgi:hypothetical protein
VQVSKYGRTFDCFKASHTMQSTAATRRNSRWR